MTDKLSVITNKRDCSTNGFKTEEIMKVTKRSGIEENLTKKKIYDSIVKANECVGDDCKLTRKQIQRITDSVFSACQDMEEPVPIDKIEDMIEKKLMEASGYEVAKQYITYRYEKERVRNNQHLTEKLMAKNVVNQNANIDEFSFGGRIGEAASFVMKEYALNNLLSPMARENHLNNEIYIHDLDHYAVGDHNCLSIPFDKLLAKGFAVRHSDIRPAGSLNTALQLVAVIFQLQSLQQFGGVAATHLDWTLVPYYRKSFKKHFLDGLKWLRKLDDAVIREFSDSLLDYTETNELLRRMEVPCVVSVEDKRYRKFEDVYAYATEQTSKELHQGTEALFHNLNTLMSRSGNQLPFSSINYGTCTLPEGREIIRELLMTSIEGIGRLHKTSIFPCEIFQLAPGVNRKPGDPNYDLFKLALKSTAKRLYPNYGNCIWSVDENGLKQDREIRRQVISKLSASDYDKLRKIIKNNPYIGDKLFLKLSEDNEKIEVVNERQVIEIISFMGCRTYNGFDINFRESFEKNIRSVIETGTFYDDVISGVAKDTRGNISPVTIILPTLAMEATEKIQAERVKDTEKGIDWQAGRFEDKCVEEFLKLLDRKIHEAKEMLLERFDWQCSQPAKSAKFMYENGTMSGFVKEEGIKSALKHGTLVIGQLGVAEALQILIGKDHTTEDGMELAKRIEQLYKDLCAKFKNELKINFGVYATPAENLCYTALKKFREKYGIIKNVSDKEFFTNSFHVPVWKKINPFEKVDTESQLIPYTSAGIITYIELDADVSNNLEAIETLVNYAVDKDVPYLGINIPVDECRICGYSGVIGDSCPECGGTDIGRIRRVTGYLTGSYTEAFNLGKQDEVAHRVKHTAVCVDA